MVLKPNADRSRLVSLDAMRGLAALSVVAFHFLGRYNSLYSTRPPLLTGLHLEVYGVHLFFIISGFVIFLTLERCDRLRDFAISRFARLFPLYWGCVLLTWCVVSTFGPEDRRVGVGTMLINLTMFQSWVDAPDVDGVYWTLAVELSFYLLAGLAFACKATRSRGRVLIAVLAWIFASLALRSPFLLRLPAHDFLADRLDVHYSHLFIAGICFYVAWRDGHNLWTVLGLSYTVGVTAALDGLESAVPILGLLVLFQLVLKGRLRKVLGWRPLQFIGLSSYALYLLHQNIGYAFMLNLESVGAPYSLALIGAVILVAALATLLTFFWERPMAQYIRMRAVGSKFFGPVQVPSISAYESGGDPAGTAA